MIMKDHINWADRIIPRTLIINRRNWKHDNLEKNWWSNHTRASPWIFSWLWLKNDRVSQIKKEFKLYLQQEQKEKFPDAHIEYVHWMGSWYEI